MKKSNYPKAVRCTEEDDFSSFVEWCHISVHYDSCYGLIIFFPQEVENYSYVAFGRKLVYICAQIGNETRSFGSIG